MLIKDPRKLFVKGSQSIIYQLFLRLKYNNKISLWLDDFLDNHFLKIN